MRRALGFPAIAISLAFLNLGPRLEAEYDASPSPQTEGLEVEARGLRVVGEAYGGDQSMRPFNYFSGTTVVLLATRPSGGLIRVDEEASRIKTFVDERGKNLLVKGEFNQPGLNPFAQISPDGKAAILEVFGGGIPTRGSGWVSISGTIVFHAATTKQTFRDPNVKLEEGAVIQTGPVRFEIVKVGKPDWGDEPLAITVAVKQDLHGVAEIRFLDDAGETIEYRDGGTMSSRIGNKVDIKRTFRLTESVATLTVEIDYWTDIKSVEAPFEAVVSLGF